MNIKRALRIAKEQPWWNAYVKNVEERHGSLEKFLKILRKEDTAALFIESAFPWFATPEGSATWTDINNDFKKKYNDNSVKVFVRESYGNVTVAKLINAGVDDELRFISALKDAGICYDSVEWKDQDLIAYKTSYKIVEEWI